MRRTIPVEELVIQLEAEAEEAGNISEEEGDAQDLIDPEYLAHLASVYEELIQLVDSAGGELDMTVYSRYLFDELYLGRFAAPFYFNLGLEVIYEE